MTDLTQIAIAEDSLGKWPDFQTFLIHEQNLSGSFLLVSFGFFCWSLALIALIALFALTISSTLLEEWILTVLHM